MRQCESRNKYCPITGKYIKKHIYGEGIVADTIKNVIFSKTTKDIVKKGAKKIAKSAVQKTSEYAGKKAGEKIVKYLKNRKTLTKTKNSKQMPQDEIIKRLNNLLNNGKEEIKYKSKEEAANDIFESYDDI